jgi:hypothetical protein
LTADARQRRPDFVSSGRRYLIRTMTIPRLNLKLTDAFSEGFHVWADLRMKKPFRH